MNDSYILCRYSEDEEGRISLVKVGEFSAMGEAREHARSLKSNYPKARFVVLTELIYPYDSRAS